MGAPFINSILKRCYILFSNVFRFPKDSASYWNDRYSRGGTSGKGSYGDLAEFKAEVINDFVENNYVETVIEFGSGDGNQVSLMRYDRYVGFDVSLESIKICRGMFEGDVSKRFELYDDYQGERADLSLSLDVIYHLVEDSVYKDYMEKLFYSSDRFVIIYSSNVESDSVALTLPHVKHRKFSSWVEHNFPEWRLVKYIPNKYPYSNGDGEGSFADFFIYSKVS